MGLYRRASQVFTSAALAALVACTSFAYVSTAHAAASGGATDPLADHNMCGPKCLYALLRIYGCPVTSRVVNDCRPTNPEGLSLEELRLACSDHGLDSDVRRCTLDELGAGGAVAIVHIRQTPDRAHFVIFLGSFGNHVKLLDASTATQFEDSRDHFCKIWTGYALVPRKQAATIRLAAGGSVAIWTVVSLIAAVPRRASKR